jgi:hypothetical protein
MGYRPLLAPTVAAIEQAVRGKTSLTQADLDLIGGRHGVHPNTVRAIWNRQRQRLGLPRPGRGQKKLPEHQETKVCGLYASRCHVVETAAHLGISRSAFYKVLHRRGVPVRTKGRAA